MKSKAKTKKILKYTVIFEKAKEGGYVAYVPVLAGCVTQGETFEETKENAKDAIEAYIAVLQEYNDPVPVEHDERISITVNVAVKGKGLTLA